MTPYYQHGGITIFHGDCREVLPTLGSADLLLSDPPYKFHTRGGGFHGDWNSRTWGNADHSKRTYLAELSELNSTDFDVNEFWTCLSGSPVNPQAIVVSCNKELLHPYLSCGLAGDWLFDIHFLNKNNPIPAKQHHFLHDAEYIVVLRRRGSHFDTTRPFDHYRKIFTAYNSGDNEHPAQKPLALMEKYIGVLCPPFGSVLDPYMGGGTTLVAAKALGRNATGIEIEEQYCEIAAKRLSQEVLNFEEVR